MAYTRVNWQNSPSHATPLSAENLNVMDAGIASLDTAVTEAEGDISSLETTVEGHTSTISGLQTTVNGHTTSIGTLANLTTTEKSNLVGAINEVNEDVSDVKEDLNSFESKVDDALKVGTYGTNVSFTRHDTGYINPTNGNIVAATNDVAYTKISVNPGETYLISAFFTSNIGIAFYKADGTFISGSGISFDTVGTNNIYKMPVEVPQNAYVMGVSTRYQSTSPIGIQKAEALYGKMRESANAIEETATGDFVIIDDANELPVKEIVSTISSASSGTVIVSGKNLMPRFTPGTSKGVVFTVNDDGSVTASGTSDANNAYVGINFPATLIKMLKGRRICVSGGGDSSSYIQLEVKVPGSTYYRTTEAKGYYTYVVPEATTSIYASVNVRNSGTTINKTFYPQIEILTEYPLGYEKSNVKLYTANWNTEAGTITSGSVNLTTGEVISGNNTYEIDPIEVVLNYGRNYIFSDCGNVTVQYRADTTLYETTDVITKMPEYVQKNLAIKHIGQLSKPYLCLTSDDGEEELATYTIPMIISKGVPMTFAIWGTSEVMLDPDYLAIVKDAVDNHGCEIAQHGRDAWVKGEQWDGLVPTEQQLYEFFEAEKAVFENAGLTVRGCACPYGYVTPRLLAQCGGYFNVFRTTNYYTEGYNVFYDHACCGPRSNMYGLYSRGITAYSTEQWIENIDYAIAHNYLIVLYIHDANLSAEDKVTLETMIDYAKAHNVTFCNLGDIPFIN